MKFHNKFAIVWWAVLLIGFLLLIVSRFESVTSENVIVFDYLILILFFIIAFIPFFSEMSIMGLKFKRDIEAVESSINDLKSLIMTNSNSSVINFSHPINQPLTPEQKEQIVQNLGVEEEKNIGKLNKYIDDERRTVDLFIIRFEIEKELKRIAVSHFSEPNEKTMMHTIRVLDNHGVFTPSVSTALREVYFITSKAIHANEIEETQREFVLEIGPTLIERLKLIK